LEGVVLFDEGSPVRPIMVSDLLLLIERFDLKIVLAFGFKHDIHDLAWLRKNLAKQLAEDNFSIQAYLERAHSGPSMSNHHRSFLLEELFDFVVQVLISGLIVPKIRMINVASSTILDDDQICHGWSYNKMILKSAAHAIMCLAYL